MRVLICGDREYFDSVWIKEVLDDLNEYLGVDCVIEGECRGADRAGRIAAEGLGIPVEPYPADWDQYGKSAGPIRNRQMLKEGKPDLVLAFHSNIEKSKGTKDMIFAANKAGIQVRLYP